MKKTVKALSLILTIVMMFTLCACSASDMPSGNKNLKIVTTIFPEYDWVMNILGDNPADADVTLLLKNGVDIHSFQPSAEDILTISSCDLFIYVGGESDEWVDEVLSGSVNKKMIVLNLMDILGESAFEEEAVEGMQTEDTDDSETEYDEHVWLSLRNAELFCKAIEAALEQADPANSSVYRNNLSSYTDKLTDLDNRYRETIENAELHTLLFADRFPFRYLTGDYGLDYYAAFSGCSAESEAGFETIRFLADKTDSLALPAVIIIDGSDGKLAETIINSSKSGDCRILTLDSMQSVTNEQIKNGTDYLTVMENNLAVLSSALNP